MLIRKACLIKQKNTQSRVQKEENEKVSDPFGTTVGVKQGGNASPTYCLTI
jgi:hypothetical protein